MLHGYHCIFIVVSRISTLMLDMKAAEWRQISKEGSNMLKKRGLDNLAVIRDTIKTEITSVELPSTVWLQNRSYQCGSCCQTSSDEKQQFALSVGA